MFGKIADNLSVKSRYSRMMNSVSVLFLVIILSSLSLLLNSTPRAFNEGIALSEIQK
ncbi:MAG: hypothetical protein MI743_04615 [Sneathiellales bacterium]|nr:hypothetical protein [Sneathiellales bacterium]